MKEFNAHSIIGVTTHRERLRPWRGEDVNEVVGSERDGLGESKIKGGGDGIRIGDRHGRGVGTELRQWGERLEWGGMEWSKCRLVGS